MEFRDRDGSVGSLRDLSAIAGERIEVKPETKEFFGSIKAILTDEQIRQMDRLFVERERRIVSQLASMNGPLKLETVEHLYTEAKSIMILRQVMNLLKPTGD